MIRTVTHLLLSGIYIINGWGVFSKPEGKKKKIHHSPADRGKIAHGNAEKVLKLALR